MDDIFCEVNEAGSELESETESDPSWINEGLEGSDDDDIFKDNENGDNDETEEVLSLDGWLSDPCDDEVLSLNGSSDGEHWPEFNEDVDMMKPELKVGMIFSTPQVFRNALREWNVQNGYDIKFTKNEGTRVTAVDRKSVV